MTGKRTSRVTCLIAAISIFAVTAILLPLFSCLSISAFAGAGNKNPDAAAAAVSAVKGSKSVTELMDEINQQRERLDMLNAQIEEYRKNIENGLNATTLQSTVIEYYDLLLADYDEKIVSVEQIIASYDQWISQIQSQINVLKARFDDNYAFFSERLRQSYEEGNPSVLEIFFSSKSFIDMLTSIERASDVLSYDRKCMEELNKQCAELEASRAEVEALRNEQSAYRDELAGIKAECEAEESAHLEYNRKLESDMTTYLVLISENQAYEQMIRAEVEKAAEELKMNPDPSIAQTKEYKMAIGVPDQVRAQMEAGSIQKGSEYFADGNTYIYPVDMKFYYTDYFSSAFGTRVDPVTHKTVRTHSGIDLANGIAKGQDIYAARSGVVITSKYNTGYGYYMVIRHEDGTFTWYAHCSKLIAQAGEYVFQGEKVAEVGNSGRVTGTHLHFEIRDGQSEPVNPINFLTMPKYWRNGTEVRENYYLTHF